MKIILFALKSFCVIYLIVLSAYLFTDFSNIFHYVVHGLKKEQIFGYNYPSNWSLSLYWFFQVLSIGFKAYAIYLLFVFKDIIHSFYKDNFFTKTNGQNLILIGSGIILLIFLFGLTILPFNIYESLNSKILPNRVNYKYGYGLGKTLKSFMPLLMFSMFFILLGNIIKKGQKLQEENDLTI